MRCTVENEDADPGRRIAGNNAAVRVRVGKFLVPSSVPACFDMEVVETVVKSEERGCLPWLIVFASFAVSFIQVGFSYSYGLLLPSVASHFQVSRADHFNHC